MRIVTVDFEVSSPSDEAARELVDNALRSGMLRYRIVSAAEEEEAICDECGVVQPEGFGAGLEHSPSCSMYTGDDQ